MQLGGWLYALAVLFPALYRSGIIEWEVCWAPEAVCVL
jgi:hypothetical protein